MITIVIEGNARIKIDLGQIGLDDNILIWITISILVAVFIWALFKPKERFTQIGKGLLFIIGIVLVLMIAGYSLFKTANMFGIEGAVGAIVIVSIAIFIYRVFREMKRQERDEVLLSVNSNNDTGLDLSSDDFKEESNDSENKIKRMENLASNMIEDIIGTTQNTRIHEDYNDFIKVFEEFESFKKYKEYSTVILSVNKKTYKIFIIKEDNSFSAYWEVPTMEDIIS